MTNVVFIFIVLFTFGALVYSSATTEGYDAEDPWSDDWDDD